MRKIKISKELAYIFAIILLSFAVAMISSTNFGVSMIVAPAYILSQKISNIKKNGKGKTIDILNIFLEYWKGTNK